VTSPRPICATVTMVESPWLSSTSCNCPREGSRKQGWAYRFRKFHPDRRTDADIDDPFGDRTWVIRSSRFRKEKPLFSDRRNRARSPSESAPPPIVGPFVPVVIGRLNDARNQASVPAVSKNMPFA